MKQAVLGHEQKFFVNGTKLHGVQKVNGSYSIEEKPINVIGWGHVNHNFNNLVSALVDEEDRSSGYFRKPEFVVTEEGFRILNNDSCRLEQDDMPKSLAVVNSPMQGSFSIDSFLVGEDYMLQYTGDNPFTGSIHHGRQYFGFYHGYINSHSVSCSIGQVPRLSTNITVFGDMGGNPDFFAIEDDVEDRMMQEENPFSFAIDGTAPDMPYNASGDNPFPDIRIPDQGSISIECAGSKTDRVTSFNHSINANLRPIYVIGKRNAVQVDVSWPITSSTTFTLEVDEYEYHRMKEYLIKPQIDDVLINIDDCFGQNVQNYVIKQARMIGEQVTASAEGRLTVNLTYNSYYNKR